ncbi:hypothetical protein ACFWIB_15500 [Streptomyces sp. NPDC127051]|uniref:hypothetical protein n=1 Tax=Streptomyces sp. NPDC127051 TaxID=3347119 RepID=UPI00365AFDCC
MADREITPSGCRHCGIPQIEHMGRWKPGPGWHVWAAPTNRQVLARMTMRRAFRLESK